MGGLGGRGEVGGPRVVGGPRTGVLGPRVPRHTAGEGAGEITAREVTAVKIEGIGQAGGKLAGRCVLAAHASYGGYTEASVHP